MKIAYITAQTPFGNTEAFILEEMIRLQKEEVSLTIFPRNPPREIFHNEALNFLKDAVWLPLFNFNILREFIISLIIKPKIMKMLYCIIKKSRSYNIFLKNLIVFPKAVYIAKLIREMPVDHIHAHWGSTTSTMALIISELTGIPWSMTLHRWDIKENNLLKIKAEKAAFLRCISENGKNEVLQIVGKRYNYKVKVLHLGVNIPNRIFDYKKVNRREFVISCPANIIPVKGHKYLIEACYLLKKRGISNLECLIIGDGSLEADVKKQVCQLNLENIVKFLGRLPHEKIIQMYEKSEVDVVIIPSIVTHDGEKEGIPVSLMEAMAYGIPVISTNTGSISELLGDGAGIMVPAKSSADIADSIWKLMQSKSLREKIARAGLRKVKESFNNIENTKNLIKMFESELKI